MINEHALEAWDQVAILRHIPNDVMELMIVHRRLCGVIVEGGLFKLLLADSERLQLWQATIFTGKTRDIGIDQPDVGGRYPEISRINVVLPAPFGPNSPST